MYRPPEMIDQYLKYPVSVKSDIWMLGCILYTLCFAKHPFFEAQKLAIINAHYYIPEEDFDRITTKMRDFIRVMLTPDPRKRPDINKLISIVDDWDELDAIPLNDDAFQIKAKHHEIQESKLKSVHSMPVKHEPPLVKPASIEDLFDQKPKQKVGVETQPNWADFDPMFAKEKEEKKAEPAE